MRYDPGAVPATVNPVLSRGLAQEVKVFLK